jgi:hypothetical protein
VLRQIIKPVAEQGFEHLANSSGKSRVGAQGGAESGAVGAANPPDAAHDKAAGAGPTDPTLARLIAAWPILPADVKAGIGAMVEAATPDGA